MALTIDAAQARVMWGHASEGFPHEVVGILAGDRQTNRITRVHPLVNERADSAHNRYRVSGLHMMRAEQQLDAMGLDVVGYYHSHPDHPSQYSDYDRDHALPNMFYVIVSVCSGKVASTQCWRLLEDRSAMDEQTLVVDGE